MAYDETTQRVYMLGGTSGYSYGVAAPLFGFWQWDGLDWQQLWIPQPMQRAAPAMSGDGMGGLLVFGGYTKTTDPAPAPQSRTASRS